MAKPAVREMGVSDARANMTEVIAEVRLLGTPVVLTRREKAQAVLVSVNWYEQAKKDRDLLRAALQVVSEMDEGERTPALLRIVELLNEAAAERFESSD